MAIITQHNGGHVLQSELDSSVNFVRQIGTDPKARFETRIVQRTPETIIFYLSTHGGCNLSCRFCWLTQQGLTSEAEAGLIDFRDQMEWIVRHLKDDSRLEAVKTIHVNFMSRGDPLNSWTFVNRNAEIFRLIDKMSRKLIPHVEAVKFKISTIFPDSFIEHAKTWYTNLTLRERAGLKGTNDMQSWILATLATQRFGHVEFYYSLYSMQDDFRKRWLPKALPPKIVGHLFRDHKVYDDLSYFRLHYALIKGANDEPSNADDIIAFLAQNNIECNLNIVRYNSFGEHTGEETDSETIQNYIDYMRRAPEIKTAQLVTRVGIDSYASCGTFVSGDFQ